MTGTLGNLCLFGAMVSSVMAAACGLAGSGRGAATWLRGARAATVLSGGLIASASALLVWQLVAHDFSNAYVFAHTDRSLGVVYRVSAFWAGQEGSILLWALLLSAVSGVHAWRTCEGVSAAVLGGIVAFFAGLLVFAASPFEARAATADGAGLNPMLRHWAMVLHPPLLLMGYAGFAAPMAMVIGGVTGQGKGSKMPPAPAFTADLRRWAICAWVCLSIGMALGAWWAYVELGWGGYWAWDPVENASLVPWLTGLALVHAIAAHRRCGGFGAWIAWLAVGTFAVCVLGTALTRSGLLASVHAFAQSRVGLSFFGLLAAVCAGGAWALLVHRGKLSGRSAGTRSIEGLVHAGLWVLVAMAGATLAGTLLPLVSGATGDPVSVGPAFYGRTVLPLAVVLIGLMGAAELAPNVSAGRVAWVIGGAALCVGSGAAAGFLDWRFMVCAVVSGAVLGGAGFEMWRGLAPSLALRARIAGCSANVPKNGATRLMAHVGMALLAIGVAGSSVFAERTTRRLAVGESLAVGGYTMTLDEVRRVRGVGWEAGEAVLRVRRGEESETVLRPQQRFYGQFGESTSEVTVRSGVRQDVYVALVGWTVGGTAASIAVHVNPLVSWIWMGAGLMALGGAGSVFPRMALRPVRQATMAMGEPAGARSAVGSSG